MKNHKFSARCVYLNELLTGQLCWTEIHETSYAGKTIRTSREVCTDCDRRGYFTSANGFDFYCGPADSEEFRCIDFRKCKTLKQCKTALNKYYSAINATPDKYPGQII